MGSRLLGRLLTSPVAFLLAGLAELFVYWTGVLRDAARKSFAQGAGRRL